MQIAIVVFGLVSGGGVTGRSDDQPTSVSQTDLTGGKSYIERFIIEEDSDFVTTFVVKTPQISRTWS